MSKSSEKSIPVKQPSKNLSGHVKALMPGKILKVLVNIGDSVSVGTPLLIIESMKMEIPINSNYKGKIKEILVKEGDMIDEDEIVIILE